MVINNNTAELADTEVGLTPLKGELATLAIGTDDVVVLARDILQSSYCQNDYHDDVFEIRVDGVCRCGDSSTQKKAA